MTPNNRRENATLLWVAFSVVVVWLALLMASCYKEGQNIFLTLAALSAALETPFAIQFNGYSIRFVALFLLAYGLGIACYYSTRENRRPGEEYGSAAWGNPRQLNRKYRDKNEDNNIILTEKVRLGLDGYKHKKNLNVLVIGGSGSGKTRTYAKPNIMQASFSYLIIDTKSEILRATASLLKAKGYVVKVFNLVNPEQSDRYNFFVYLRRDTDVLKLIANLIHNTTPKSANSGDPFWEKAEIALDSALILYLLHEAPPEEKNFAMVMYMLENATVREDDEDYQSPLDMLFEDLEEREPNHIAVKQYKIYKQAAGKTAKSILVSAAVRLAAFNLPEIARITSSDDLEIGMLGERKQAIFCIIPDNDNSLNYLVAMIYAQAFQELFYRADHIHRGRLPVPVHIMAEELANVSLSDFPLQTMRSRNISMSMTFQNMAQIKELYKEAWEGIVGGCDSILYLGGNEQSTHETLSKMLGKETISTRTRGVTKGQHGSSSTNFQNMGRELLMPDEVRRLDGDYALLFIKGEPPVLDKKFNLMKHKNIKLTEDGGAEPYIHHVERPTVIAGNDLTFTFTDLENVDILEMEDLDDETKDNQ